MLILQHLPIRCQTFKLWYWGQESIHQGKGSRHEPIRTKADYKQFICFWRSAPPVSPQLQRQEEGTTLALTLSAVKLERKEFISAPAQSPAVENHFAQFTIVLCNRTGRMVLTFEKRMTLAYTHARVCWHTHTHTHTRHVHCYNFH